MTYYFTSKFKFKFQAAAYNLAVLNHYYQVATVENILLK